MTDKAIKTNIRSYNEGLPVEIDVDFETGRVCVVAYVEGGYSSVGIDLYDVLEWVEDHQFDLIAIDPKG